MEGWRTLETGKDAAGVEGIDCNVVLAVEVEFFLDTPYCSNKGCFSSIILNSHRTVNCSAAIIRTSVERRLPRTDVDDTSFVSCTHFRDDFVHQIHRLPSASPSDDQVQL